MSKQLHKNFTDDQVKSLLKGYVYKEIKINYILSFSESKEEDSLNYFLNTVKIPITFPSSITEKPLILKGKQNSRVKARLFPY